MIYLHILVMIPTCQIKINSNSWHLQQLYLGLSLLSKKKIIKLKYFFDQGCRDINGPASVHTSLAELKVNDKTIVFDMSDASKINEKALDRCYLYFKRSYDCSLLTNHPASKKVKPYGLNYLVLPDNLDFFTIRRSLAFKQSGEWLKQIVKTLDVNNLFQYNPRLSDLQELPDISNEPRILFIARTWDHNSDDYYQLSEKEQSDRLVINEIRANCVRELRKEFGTRFTGGLVPTPHAEKNFKDCIVDVKNMTSKRNYIQLVKKHNICIATTGLHGSIGWKFAEYVALSRSIVSETLNFSLPGKFEANKNYLEFSTVKQCIAEVGSLMDSPSKRAAISKANFDYYQHSLKPDILVWNCLLQAL